MYWRELDSVDSVESCSGVEEGTPGEVSDGMALLLELVCVAGVTAKLENGGSVTTLKDVEKWIEVISVVNATTDIVCEEVDCDSELPDSAGLCRTVAEEKAEKGDDKMLVEENKNIDSEEGLLNSAELCWTVVDEDADNPRDKIVVDGNIGSNITVGVVLIDNGVVDVAIDKIAKLDEEIADVSIVEETTEGPVDIAERLVEESRVEVAMSSIEVGDGVCVTEEMASIVESATVEMVSMIEDDVGTALVETATPEDVARIVDRTVSIKDGEGTALEERLSALMISAAFARVLDPWSY